jgi:hypothetical protein
MINYVDRVIQIALILVVIYLYLNTPSESTGNTATTAD